MPTLEILKKLPGAWGAFFAQYAFILAPLLAALAPIVAQLAQPMCAKIDPLLWMFIFAGATYLVSQLLYWLGVKAKVIV